MPCVPTVSLPGARSFFTICRPVGPMIGLGPTPEQSVPGEGTHVTGSGGFGPPVGSTVALFVMPVDAEVGITITVIALVPPLAAGVPPLNVHRMADVQVQFVPVALTKLRFTGSLSATVAVVATLEPALPTTMS